MWLTSSKKYDIIRISKLNSFGGMAESGRLRSFASRVVAVRSPVGSNPTPSLPPSFFPSFDVWF